MKTAVVYSTRTGNSKKIAETVAAALQIEAVDIKTGPVLNRVGLLFIVGGIYGGASSPVLQAFAKSLTKKDVDKVAILTSCLSRKQDQKMIRKTLVENGIEVFTEEFICRGRLLFLGLGHPDRDDLDAAVSFAQKALSTYNGTQAYHNQ